MVNHPVDEIRENQKHAEKIINHLFGKSPKEINFQPAGKTNYVFEVKLMGDEYIVRIGRSPEKIDDYIKEQWAVTKVKERDIPVADIVEVGNDIIKMPYMVQRKIPGQNALTQSDCHKIFLQLGKYAKIINSITTNGYGPVFDWCESKLSRKNTWEEYLSKEMDVSARMDILEKNKMLEPKTRRQLMANISDIRKWDAQPVLNHGDLRLKNILIDDDSNIVGIIDWEDCCSNIAPYWDFSIAFHDLSIDDKQDFLIGYGMEVDEFRGIVFALRTFNILNYTTVIENLAAEKNEYELEHYRLRLNGYYDLYSL